MLFATKQSPPPFGQDAYRVYLFIQGFSALMFGMIFTASSLYQVTVAGLSPLQLVLVGTTLEAAAFLFEVPTGVVADAYSRRLSVIIGWFLIGGGFLLEGSFPIFWVILSAQVLWGLGYTFTSGATQAWITDEIGEAAAGRAFLRSGQVEQVASLLGIGAGILLGLPAVNLPIQVGGALLASMGGLLLLVMPETGFHPTLTEDRDTFSINTASQNMLHIFRQGLGVVRQRPALKTILWIGFIYGLYSEGLDRLWVKHLLDDFNLQSVAFLSFIKDVQPVVWIGVVRGAGMLFSLGAVELARRKIDTSDHHSVARGMLFISLLLVAALFTFAVSPSLALALVAYWTIAMLRSAAGPLYTAWVNQRLDSQVRATVLSMSSQVDAIGQIAGGPTVGLIGSLASVRAALLASALALSPVIPLLHRSRQRSASPVTGPLPH